MEKSLAQPQKLSKRNLWAYSLGTIGRDASYALWSNFLLSFVLFTKSLTTAQFAAISIIMVAARIFDAINDPIMGNILEVTRTRWGKFKPWIACGAALTIFVYIFSFSNTLQGWSYVIVFGILYFLFSISFTMNDISYWGMVPSLAGRADDRNKLTSITIFMAGIGQFLATALVPLFTVGALVIGGNAITAYRYIAIIFSLFFATTTMITLFGVKEKPLPPPSATAINKVSLKKVIKTLSSNDQLVWGAVIFLAFSVSNLLMNGGLSMSYIYFEFGYNGMLMTIFGLASNLAAVALMVSFTALSRRFSRNQMVRTAVIGALCGYGIMLLSGLLIPSGAMPYVKFGVLTFGNVFVFVSQTLIYMIMMICIANTVEYNEWKTGNRDEGIIFSVRPFTTKLSSALVQLITMAVYILVGVRDYTNQISDLENSASAGLITAEQKSSMISDVVAGVSDGRTLALLLCTTLIPSILLLVGHYFYKRKYTITEEMYDNMLNDIAARKS